MRLCGRQESKVADVDTTSASLKSMPGACVGGRGHAGCLSHIALKQSSITFKVSPAARLFACAIKRRINNTWVFSQSFEHRKLIGQTFSTPGPLQQLGRKTSIELISDFRFSDNRS
jgi:hypothetical protein